MIACSELTTDNVSDPTATPYLLDSADSLVDRFLADRANDGDPTSDLLAARFGWMIEVTILLPKTAILSLNVAKDPTARDGHIADIAAHRLKATGYNQRSRCETLMG